MSITIKPNKAAIIRWAKAQDASMTPEALAKRYGMPVAAVKDALSRKDDHGR